MYQYFLTHKDQKILLFESKNKFKTEAQCLKQYEKGLVASRYSFDRSRIDQVWSELMLSELIRLSDPVELVRVLCANGAMIKCTKLISTTVLKKSYNAVLYFVEVLQRETSNLDRFVIGHYYTTIKLNADRQFPKLCKLLETDLNLPVGTFQVELSKLFYKGFRVISFEHGKKTVLAQNDLNTKIIRGIGNEDTLFYVGLAEALDNGDF